MSHSSYVGIIEERVCNICLSSDRKLFAMRHMVIPQDWIDIGLNILYGKLCWECSAVINKMSCFKKKAMLAQQVLKREFELSQFKSLSTLNYKLNDARDFFYKMHTDIDNHLELDTKARTHTIVKKEIKEEPVCDDAQSNNELHEHVVEFVEIDIKDNEIKDLTLKQETVSDFQDNNSHLNVAAPESNVTQFEDDDMFKNCNSYFVCTLTEEEVLNQRDKEKTMIQYLKANFKCETCVLLFRSMERYAAHMVDCHSKAIGNFVCGICACRFKSQQMLDDHTRSHNVIYRCGICRHQNYYRDLLQMKTHMRVSHSGDYTCEECGAVFNSKGTFRYHRRTQHKSKEHCDQCGKVTTNLKAHQETHKKSPTEECTICHKVLKSINSLRFHMLTHTKPNKDEAYCAECDVYYKNKQIYKSHLKNNAKHAKADKECDYCRKRFVSKLSLAKHINVVHFNKLDHICQLCGKKFSVASHLRSHIKVVHEGIARPRKFVCELCGKGFTLKIILDEHVNTHTGARPYKCDKCPAQFGFKAALYTHNKLKHLKLKKSAKTATDAHSKKTETT